MFTAVDIKCYYHFWGADVVTKLTYDFYTYIYSVHVKFIGLYLLTYYVFGMQFAVFS